MKIGIVVNRFQNGVGISEYVNSLFSEISKDHECHIITPQTNFRETGLKVVKIEPKVKIKTAKDFFSYRIDDLEKYDLIIGNYPTVACTKTAKAISKKQKIPYISIDYGIAPPSHFKGVIPKLAHIVGAAFRYQQLRKADKVLTISHFLKKELDRKKIKSTVIHGGVVYEKYQKDYNTRILDKLNLKPKNYVVFVGRLSPHKGTHIIAECLRKADKNLKLVAAGGYDMDNYSERLKSFDNLIITGYLNEEPTIDLLRNCMFYATGSQWEGLNLTLLEAQASGVPVICFDAGAHKEIVGQKSGFVVKTEEEMVEKMTLLSSDSKLRDRMGKEAKDQAKNFDWKSIAKTVEKLIS